MDSSPISAKAERCAHLFQLIDTRLDLDPGVKEWLETVQLRANLLTSKLGVFAAGSLSIDHRLRRNKTVSRALIQILNAILSNTRRLSSALGIDLGASIPNEQSSETTSDSPPEVLSDSDTDDEGVEPTSEDGLDALEESIDASIRTQDERSIEIRTLCECISENVDDLLQYAARIKQYSTAKSGGRAEQYSPQASEDDSSGPEDERDDFSSARGPLAAKFTTYAGHVLRREIGPERYADPSLAYLRNRLQSSMVRRWRRVCYRHAHAENLATRSRSRQQAGPQERNLQLPTPAPTPNASIEPSLYGQERSDIAASVVSRLPSSAATTLQSSFSVTKAPQPRSETTKSASRAGGTELSLPPVPRSQRLNSEYLYDCPYCGRLPMTRKPLTSRSWRTHLWLDLGPYVCLYEPCTRPDVEYTTFHAWVEHVKVEHWKPLWTCAQCPESPTTYATQDTFLSHLLKAHAIDGSTVALQAIAKYSCLESSCSECVICGSEQGIGGTPENERRPVTSTERQHDIHACMANHLESLSLSSLPWHFGITHDSSSSQAEGSNPAERSSHASSTSDTRTPHSDLQSSGAATLATIALHAEEEGQDSVLDMVAAWNTETDVALTDEDDETFSPGATAALHRPNQDHSSSGDGGSKDLLWAQAKFDFEAAGLDRLAFQKGDSIRITDDSAEIWWEGQCNGKTGRFPNYAVETLGRPGPRLSADPAQLWRAAESGDKALVKLLVDVGKIDLNAKDKTYGQAALLRAAKNGREAVVELLIKTGKVDATLTDNFGMTPLAWAAKNGSAPTVELLLNTGAHLDSKGDTVGATPLLLDSMGSKYCDSNDNLFRQTPLSQAAEKGHTDVVKTLLSTGLVNVNARQTIEHQTPLWWSTKNGHQDVVRLLLQVDGVDVDAADEPYAQTPLSVAAENGHAEIVEMLLQAGAKVLVRDKHGLTPSDWATKNGHQAMADMLDAIERGDALEGVGAQFIKATL